MTAWLLKVGLLNPRLIQIIIVIHFPWQICNLVGQVFDPSRQHSHAKSSNTFLCRLRTCSIHTVLGDGHNYLSTDIITLGSKRSFFVAYNAATNCPQ